MSSTSGHHLIRSSRASEWLDPRHDWSPPELGAECALRTFSYGPQGFEAIINSINTYMIQRDPLILAHRTAPLDVATYLRRVMVPEAAIALIIDDYSGAPDGPIDRSRATEVLRESRAYGAAVFALDGTFGRDGLNKAAETAAEKKQRHREEDEAEKEREAVLASGDRRRIRAVERGPKAFAQIKKALKAAERSAKRS